MLQAVGELADDDLEAAYAYPAERTWVRLNFVAAVDGATADLDGRSDHCRRRVTSASSTCCAASPTWW